MSALVASAWPERMAVDSRIDTKHHDCAARSRPAYKPSVAGPSLWTAEHSSACKHAQCYMDRSLAVSPTAPFLTAGPVAQQSRLRNRCALLIHWHATGLGPGRAPQRLPQSLFFAKHFLLLIRIIRHGVHTAGPLSGAHRNLNLTYASHGHGSPGAPGPRC
jgi:hypothetical protein